MKKPFTVFIAVFLTTLVFQTSATAQDKNRAMPKPATTIGVDLFTALSKRASTRQFNPQKAVSYQALANLLWAANGVNRPDGHRTAPAARNIQFIEIYVALSDGIYRYNPKEPKILYQVSGRDIRNTLFMQSDYAKAPVALLFVHDKSVKPANLPDDKAANFAWNAAGLMEQNVGLAAAAQKLGAVVVGSIRADVAADALKLNADKTLLVAMAIGHPAE